MKVLHLVGSQTSEYYYGVSVLYAPDCIKALSDAENVVLLGQTDGTWSIPKDLNDEAEVAKAARITLPEALKQLEDVHKPEVMQPHMFCYRGMVTCRYLADMLGIPLVGCPGHVMALTTDKWQTRAVVASFGVTVPKAQLLREGDAITMEPPFILKPCREDNSMGITLVRDASNTEDALKTAFNFDDLILCEQYIPYGREIRVGIVEDDDGTLELLPVMEYFLHDKADPIRTSADKITEGDKGKLGFNKPKRACPAEIDDVLKGKLFDMATKAHRALGFQHYSLYDVRVDPDGEPFFIEAGAYCSFSPNSVIVMMSTSEGKYGVTDLFYRFANRAIREYVPIKPTGDKANQKRAQQTYGMRSRPVKN